VKWIETGGNGATDGRGAGIARNMGADVARGDFLLFLDADDWLYPDALDKMMSAWDRDHNIIYSDYVGKAIIDKKYASELGDRLLHYNESGESVISYRSLDFDCERAKREPTFPNYPYVWNLITSLVPKSWHVEIGGFDESMESWEDWDYWLRMVRSGKCFTRIAEPLVVYRFYTGYRREHGAKIGESLVKYLTDKYEESNMGCNCKDKKTPAQQSISISASRTAATDMVDEEFVLIKYMSPNKGQHTVVGLVTGKKYGHRAGGDMFYVHISDVKRAPNMFAIVERKPSTPKIEKKELKPPDRINIVPNEENLTNDLDGGLILAQVPGVTAAIADQFKALGLDTAESIISMGAGDLSSKVKGVGEIRAEAIIAFLKETQ
jgi:hypothetical protein